MANVVEERPDPDNNNNVVVKRLAPLTSCPRELSADVRVSNNFTFRRHYSFNGRYVYRLFDGCTIAIKREDTLTGAVITYTPEDAVHNFGIHRILYYRELNDHRAILIFWRLPFGHRSTHIAFVDVCPETCRFDIIHEVEFTGLDSDCMVQATIFHDERDYRRMLCVFLEDVGNNRDRSCLAFFRVRNNEVRIERELTYEMSIYMPRFHGDFVDCFVEHPDEDAEHRSVYHLERLDLRTNEFTKLMTNVDDVLNPHEKIKDFCWYEKELYCFTIIKDPDLQPGDGFKCGLLKYNIAAARWYRIEFPLENHAQINNYSKFAISANGMICFSETIYQSHDGAFSDRFFQIPLRRPASLLDIAWIRVRNTYSRKRKRVVVPYTFEYGNSPVCKKPHESDEEDDEAMETNEDSGYLSATTLNISESFMDAQEDDQISPGYQNFLLEDSATPSTDSSISSECN